MSEKVNLTAKLKEAILTNNINNNHENAIYTALLRECLPPLRRRFFNRHENRVLTAFTDSYLITKEKIKIEALKSWNFLSWTKNKVEEHTELSKLICDLMNSLPHQYKPKIKKISESEKSPFLKLIDILSINPYFLFYLIEQLTICEKVKSELKRRVDIEQQPNFNLVPENATAYMKKIMHNLLVKKTDNPNVDSIETVNPKKYLEKFTNEQTIWDQVDFKNKAKVAFNNLDPKCKELISLRIIHEFSYKEIAILFIEEEGLVPDEDSIRKLENKLRIQTFRCLKKLKSNYNN